MPYGTFSPQLPLQIKIGFWLTDVLEEKMGNLVVLPGSHREQYVDEYDSHQPIAGEQIVRVRKGTMTLMHSSIWHRVEHNDSESVRKNIFYAYCPAWVTSADRVLSDPDWLETLNREQRSSYSGLADGYTDTSNRWLKSMRAKSRISRSTVGRAWPTDTSTTSTRSVITL